MLRLLTASTQQTFQVTIWQFVYRKLVSSRNIFLFYTKLLYTFKKITCILIFTGDTNHKSIKTNTPVGDFFHSNWQD